MTSDEALILGKLINGDEWENINISHGYSQTFKESFIHLEFNDVEETRDLHIFSSGTIDFGRTEIPTAEQFYDMLEKIGFTFGPYKAKELIDKGLAVEKL